MRILKPLLIIAAAIICLILGAYFILTRPGVQKKLLADQLPEGSSVEFLQLTASGVRIDQLMLDLGEGNSLSVARVETRYSIWDALFNHTLNLGVLEIDGLNLVMQPTPSQPTTEPVESTPAEAFESDDIYEQLSAMEQLDWLIKVERININGRIQAVDSGEVEFSMTSGAIAPGQSSEINLQLSVVAAAMDAQGFKALDSSMVLSFDQKENGGINQLKVVAQADAVDGAGASVLSFASHAALQVMDADKQAQMDSDFKVEIPQPAVLSPQLTVFESIQLNGEMQLVANEAIAELTAFDFTTDVNGQSVVSAQLKQKIRLSGAQEFVGELLELRISDFPMAWLNPFLPEGYAIQGAPLSLKMLLDGTEGQGARFYAPQVITLGPISMSDPQGSLLSDLSLKLQPDFDISSEGAVTFDLGKIRLVSASKNLLAAAINGSLPAADVEDPLSEMKVNVDLTSVLPRLFEQPALARSGKMQSGRLELHLALDGSAEKLVYLDGLLSQLTSPEKGVTVPDYVLKASVDLDDEVVDLEALFAVNDVVDPKTAVTLKASLEPESSPLKFNFSVMSDQIRQADLMPLASLFEPAESKATEEPAPTPSEPAEGVIPPPWAGLDGEGTLSVKRLVLDAGIAITGISAEVLVSEPMLELKDLKAEVSGGTVAGKASVQFDASKADAYQADVDFALKSLDPSKLKGSLKSPLPIRGEFNASFLATGAGPSLNEAIEDVEGEVKLSAKDGVLTAFELDERKQQGLQLVGILGAALDQPGIAAVSETIQYFKEIGFESFNLSLDRASDKRISISQLKLIGDSLYLDGQGSIAASSLSDVMQQPMQLNLNLGAKGGLVKSLEALKLLKGTKNDAGYREWEQSLKIGGTLSDPNTDSIMDLLNRAATNALGGNKKASSSSTNTSTTTTPTKKDERKEQIKMGVELLNNVFGQ